MVIMGSYMGVQLNFTYEGKQCRSAWPISSYYDGYDDEYYYNYEITQKFEVKVLNQVNDSEHYSETQEIHLGSCGCSSWHSGKFMSTGLLYRNTTTCQYLKNDTIFFKVRNA